MSGQDERLAAIIAGLIPDGAVVLSDIVDREWMRSDGCDAASIWDAWVVPSGAGRADGDWRVYPAASMIGAPPPGSMIELMAKRIAALEDERAQASTAAGLRPDSPVSLTMQVNGLSVSVKRLQRMLKLADEEVATLRAILAAVPAPEDDEP